MTKQDHTPIPRYQVYSGPSLLAQGFRPFFLFAGIWAAVALALSFEMIQGRIEVPTVFDAVSWHYHEMLFGFVAAVIAGFLLTAIPNWTGRLPLQGIPLLSLALLWLAGRIAVAGSELIGAWLAAFIDLSFLLALASVTLREILAGRNWRNLPIVLAIILFFLCNALSHADAAGLAETGGLAQRLAIAVVVTLVTLIGGRVIPSFTRNWLVKRGAQKLLKGFGNFDRATLTITLIALAYWAVMQDGVITVSLTGLASALNLFRLFRWRGFATYPEPLLLVLHIAYLWIPIGFALLALSSWWPALPPTGALHALTAGAMGTMTLAMMSRATLGHTGRELHAGTALTGVYLLVTISALFRVSSSLWDKFYMPLLTTSAIAWIAAFVLYVCACGPMLVIRRSDRGKT